MLNGLCARVCGAAARTVGMLTTFAGNVWDSTPSTGRRTIELSFPSPSTSAEDGSSAPLQVVNLNNTNLWRTAATLLPYHHGRRYVEVIIEKIVDSTNRWKLVVGVVSSAFNFNAEKVWVGAQGTYGLRLGHGFLSVYLVMHWFGVCDHRRTMVL